MNSSFCCILALVRLLKHGINICWHMFLVVASVLVKLDLDDKDISANDRMNFLLMTE